MSSHIYRIPRYTDAKVIHSLVEVAKEMVLKNVEIRYRASEEIEMVRIAIDTAHEIEELQKLCRLENSIIRSVYLNSIPDGNEIVHVDRPNDGMVDKMTVNVSNAGRAFGKSRIVEFLSILLTKLRQLSLGSGFSETGSDVANQIIQIREASLSRLEEISAKFLKTSAEHLAELDRKFLERTRELEVSIASEKDQIRKENLATEETQRERERQIQIKENEFDIRKNTYLRRELREKFLTVVTARQREFELTKNAKRRRWPIAIFGVLLLGFFAVMTAVSYSQADKAITASSSANASINGWHVLLFVAKQAAFAIGFIGTAGFLIKWSDRWFREHADAEFMAKQFELDINRASWVVELALEWKDEKSQGIPDALLAKLSRNLFLHRDEKETQEESSPDIAQLLLGASSKVSIRTPVGEAELDRKGINTIVSESEKAKSRQ